MESNAPTLGFLLHDVARLLRRRFEQNARGSGLTRSQWHVLAYLAQNEGINQSGLAVLLEIEPITLGRIVDKLQILGLIERRPDPSDRRGWLLPFSPAPHPKPTHPPPHPQGPPRGAAGRRPQAAQEGLRPTAHGHETKT